VRVSIRKYYRRHDDFNRYLMTNKKRTSALSKLYRANRRYFGKRVLDLACGGGVLGFVIERDGHEYVGVDVNEDMINGARAYAGRTGSNCKFVLGDVVHRRAAGAFDTVTLLGNALCHFNTRDLVLMLRNLNPAVHRRSHFITDYRDVVGLLFRKEWKTKNVETNKGRTTVSITRSYDAENGRLVIDSRWKDGGNELRFTHAVWAPFVLEPIMVSNGWKLVDRKVLPKPSGWLDVYEKL
jgi:SAM-dependent methyltransferase